HQNLPRPPSPFYFILAENSKGFSAPTTITFAPLTYPKLPADPKAARAL
uniref:Uncharacterized protein n=1 Tax=Aegilops tauschii subsp. strangulata TaxID=200361 RepID=A0A452Z7T3_AEGTS